MYCASCQVHRVQQCLQHVPCLLESWSAVSPVLSKNVHEEHQALAALCPGCFSLLCFKPAAKRDGGVIALPDKDQLASLPFKSSESSLCSLFHFLWRYPQHVQYPQRTHRVIPLGMRGRQAPLQMNTKCSLLLLPWMWNSLSLLQVSHVFCSIHETVQLIYDFMDEENPRPSMILRYKLLWGDAGDEANTVPCGRCRVLGDTWGQACSSTRKSQRLFWVHCLWTNDPRLCLLGVELFSLSLW